MTSPDLPLSGAIAGALSGLAACLVLLVCDRIGIGNTLTDNGPGFAAAACFGYGVTGGLFGVAVGFVLSRHAMLTKLVWAVFVITSGAGYLAARYVTLLVLWREMRWFGDATPPAGLMDLFCLTSGIAGGLIGSGLIWSGFVACGKQQFRVRVTVSRTVIVPAILGGALLMIAVILSAPDADAWPNGRLVSLLIHLPWQAWLGFALCGDQGLRRSA